MDQYLLSWRIIIVTVYEQHRLCTHVILTFDVPLTPNVIETFAVNEAWKADIAQIPVAL